jgi:copper chaperone
MQTTTLEVKGMTCGGCVRGVERVLKAIPGVTAVDVTLADGKVRVEFDGTPPGAQFKKAIEDAGYEVTG